MAKKTRLGYEGYGVRRAGSFANKGLAPVPAAAQVAAVSTTNGLVTDITLEDGVVTEVTVELWPTS